jgi:hypothetical protein
MQSTPHFSPIIRKLGLSRQILVKGLNAKFRDDPLSMNLVFPCAQQDRKTDMKNPVVAFRSFENASGIACTFATKMFVSVKIMVFWIVLLNDLVDGHGRFGRNGALHLQSQSSILDVKAGCFSEALDTHLTNYMA